VLNLKYIASTAFNGYRFGTGGTTSTINALPQNPGAPIAAPRTSIPYG
jgi:hypothetical protein